MPGGWCLFGQLLAPKSGRNCLLQGAVCSSRGSLGHKWVRALGSLHLELQDSGAGPHALLQASLPLAAGQAQRHVQTDTAPWSKPTNKITDPSARSWCPRKLPGMLEKPWASLGPAPT